MKEILTKIFNNCKHTLQKLQNKKKSPIKHNKSTNIIVDNIKTILIALVLAIVIRSFLFEPFHIPSGSMKPTLLDGDYIFVSKYEYGYSQYSFPLGLPIIKNRIFDKNKPQRGDIIVFRLPSNPKINYIKRLVGLPNDRIQIIDKILYINGEAIKRVKTNDHYLDTSDGRDNSIFRESIEDNISYEVLQNNLLMWDNYGINNTKEYVVPDGHYFFLGDNRDNSLDSRFEETGFIPYKNIVGKAKLIFLSKDENESLLKFWRWHKIIRFNRIFNGIK